MSDEFSPLDLKFLPDWLKEGPSTNKYAQFAGESAERPRRDGGFRGGPRSGPGGAGGPGGGRGRDSRGPGGDRNRERPRGRDGNSGKSFGERRGGGGGPRRSDSPHRGPGGPGGQGRDQRSVSGERQGPPPAFKLEFLPEPAAAEYISKQIRQSARAYPLFGTARMFLEKPERHQVRVISTEAGKALYQLENGPICFDKSLIERSAFRLCKDRFYREESREIEAPKGNYTSVARCRSTGALLGPTSHHAYPVAIRKLYEERFSRRMSFGEFQREEIEILTGEQAVADWKTQASKVTVFFTTTEAEPLEFKTLQEVEAHFQKNYLSGLIRTGNNLVCSGRSARELPERFLSQAVREAFEKELAYPGAIVHGLRHQFADQNLHVFKHRKRVLYVSSIRPTPATTTYEFAEGPATLLTLIKEHPRISKRDLAARILGVQAVPANPVVPSEPALAKASETPEASPTGAHPEGSAVVLESEATPTSEHPAPSEAEVSVEATTPTPAPESAETPEQTEMNLRKKQLAADLHYLVHTGHVIEFADGKLDLPLVAIPGAEKSTPESSEDSPQETAHADRNSGEEATQEEMQNEEEPTLPSHGDLQSEHTHEVAPEPAPHRDTPAGE
jgi:hypothetical protein